jgi:hypothetical protein
VSFSLQPETMAGKSVLVDHKKESSMTTIHSVSDQGSITDSADLPRPDTASVQTSSAMPRPVPSVNDTGRIQFGASCRIPLQK